MRKPHIATITVLAAVVILLGNAMAQQSPANPPQAPAPETQGTPATKPQQAPTAGGTDASVFKTQKDKISYAIGLNVGQSVASNLHKEVVDVDTDILVQGIRDALAGGKTLMSDDETKAVLMALQADLQKKQEVKTQQLREANKKEGDAFLAANKTKEGVVTLPSGLQYKILT
jgi:FKBP-type peptidyl-prolyl cis-trans isomerase FklB